MSEAPTHIYAYRDGYYPYWTTDPDLHRDAAQYIRADIAVGAVVAVRDHLAELEAALQLLCDLQNGPPLIRDSVAWHNAMEKAHLLLSTNSKGQTE